jgi:hypothetical protein
MAVKKNCLDPLLHSAAALSRDERGGLPDYALVTALLALLMLVALRGMAHEAGGNLNNTSTNLTNMAVHP